MALYEHVFMTRQDAANTQVDALVEQYKAIIAAGGIPPLRGFSDGPYPDDVTVADLLLGKLVGIYAPTGEIAS